MFASLSDTILINCTLKISRFKVKKRGKRLVLNVWLGAHLQEIHCCCQQKVCSVNGLIMGGVRTTKDTTPSETSSMTQKSLGQRGFGCPGLCCMVTQRAIGIY
jgi:hypothetical protein